MVINESVKKFTMDKYKKVASFSKNKETDGFVKRLIQSAGLAIALLIFMLLASGIFFTGAVVQGMNKTTMDRSHK